MLEMVWGVAVVLVLAAASVRADDLHLDVMQDELLGGEYYPNYYNSSWYIKFSAKVEGEDIVSICKIWTRKEEHLEISALKIPYRNKYSRKVDKMRIKIIIAAMAAAEVLKFPLLPATADDIAEALWNMAESLANKTADMGKNQVRFAVMYHSIIIRAALRIMNGAKQTKDICQASPDYEYAESSSLFICTQDLPQLSQVLPQFNQSLIPDDSMVPHERQRRGFFRRISRWFRSTRRCDGIICKRYRYLLGGGLCGDQHGCCGNYRGCCRFAFVGCKIHDQACTCCEHWWCLWGCKCDSHCDPVEYPDCY